MHKRKRGTHPAVGALRTRGAQNNPYKNRVAVGGPCPCKLGRKARLG